MCLISLISTCRREKYFAKTKTRTNFITSTGSKATEPRLNQLFAPCDICPKIISTIKAPHMVKNKNTNTSVCFKKRKSIKEKRKNTAKDRITQIICLPKKLSVDSSGVKDFIVTSPAPIIGIIKKTNNQSILLIAFSTIPVLKF